MATSHTILVVEADEDRAVIWTKPDDLEYDPANPAKGLGGLPARRHLLHALFRWIGPTIDADIDPEVLRSMFSAKAKSETKETR